MAHNLPNGLTDDGYRRLKEHFFGLFQEEDSK